MPPEPKLGAGSTERAACCHLHVKVKLPLTNLLLLMSVKYRGNKY